MAFTYTICEARESDASVKGSTNNGVNNVQHTMSRKFTVFTTATSPSEVNDVAISCLTELPIVNRSTWVSSDGLFTLPYAICRSKTVTRRKENAFVFDVTCGYDTGNLQGEQCAAAPPVDLTDISPQVKGTIGSYERVIYQDKSSTPKQCFRYEGTETRFDVDVVEKIPTLMLTVEQYESSIAFQDMLDRSFKTNSTTYRSKDAGLWMIGAVTATETTVMLASGEVTAVKVTYPIMLSERYYVEPGQTTKTVYGHDTIVPLVDTKYLDGGNIEINEVNGDVAVGYITDTGAKRTPAAANEERPDYLQFQTLDRIDFSTFLQA